MTNERAFEPHNAEMNRRQWLRAAGLLGLLAGRPLPFFGAEATLSYPEIQRRLAGRKIFILPYSHHDWAWVHTRQWQADRAAVVISEVLDLLKTNPEFRFFVDTWNEEVEPFLERRPERIAEFRQAVRSGQIAVCGGTVGNQHPAWMETESLIRDMVLGRRYFQRLLPGFKTPVMAHNDVTPGPAQMPQILRKAGYRAYRFYRPDEALSAENVPRNFVWAGLDGSEILVSRGTYGGFMTTESLPQDFASNWKQAVVNFYEQEVAHNLEPRGGNLVWLSMGADDSRPLRIHPRGKTGREELLPVPEFIRKWSQTEQVPLAFATPLEYFRELEKERAELPRHEGVLEPTIWTYWYGLNGNRGLRLWRKRADQALVAAECFSSVVSSLGQSYPQERFEALWRDLLGAYSHAQMWLFQDDYEPQLTRVKSTLHSAVKMRDEALQHVAGRVRLQPQRSCVLLFNDLPWARTEVVKVWAPFQQPGTTNLVVRDPSGGELPFQVLDVNDIKTGERHAPITSLKEVVLLVKARVPALGYTTLYFDPAPGTLEITPPKTSGERLDSEAASIEFSNHGVELLLDKASQARYEGAGNVIYNQINDVGPYHYGPVVNTLRWQNAELVTLDDGPLRHSFTLQGPLGPHQVRLIGHLYPHARRIGFQARIDSAGGSGHFMTTVGLPSSGKLTADVHFGVEDRDPAQVAYKGVERLRENVFYGAHWADYSDSRRGLTLLASTGERGYRFFPRQNVLGHFLLMTNQPATNWERFVTRAREGTGRHRFDYQMLFHSGDWREAQVVRRALEAQHPFSPVYANNRALPHDRNLPEEKSFFELQPATVQLTAFYWEAGRYWLRLYESSGAQAEVSLRLPFPVSQAQEVNFHGEPLVKNIAVSENALRFEIQPWEIVTLAIR